MTYSYIYANSLSDHRMAFSSLAQPAHKEQEKADDGQAYVLLVQLTKDDVKQLAQ